MKIVALVLGLLAGLAGLGVAALGDLATGMFLLAATPQSQLLVKICLYAMPIASLLGGALVLRSVGIGATLMILAAAGWLALGLLPGAGLNVFNTIPAILSGLGGILALVPAQQANASGAPEGRGLQEFRLALWTLVIVAAVGATALFLLRPPQTLPGSTVPTVQIARAAFALESTTGGTFTEQSLKGTPSLVFFGYTFCPDVCPTTLAESVAWKQAAGITDAQLRTIFVTVDPERDTKDVLKEYLGGFDPDVIGLVGTAAETEAAKASFGVMSEKGDDSGDGFYLVNHTASVFLIGRDGSFQGTIAYGEPSDTAVGKIKKLVGG